MRAAVYRGPRTMQLEEVPQPGCGPNDVLCRVLACGICGSDLHGYKLGMWAEEGWVMGHEISVEVAQVGEAVTGLSKGDRIFPISRRGTPCRECFWCLKGRPYLCDRMERREITGYSSVGGYAEYLPLRNVDAAGVLRVPASLGPEEAAFVEPLTGAMHWVSLAEPREGDTVVIIGCGTIGLLCLQLMKLVGARVIAVEPSELRRRTAGELGADVVIDPRTEDPLVRVIDETRPGKFFFGAGGAAADIVMECAGKPQTLNLAMEMARSGGRVLLVGLYEEPAPINPNLIIHKDLKLISSFGHGEARPLGDESPVRLLSEGKVRVGPLITHRFPLAQINEAFEQQLRTEESIKVLVLPHA